MERQITFTHQGKQIIFLIFIISLIPILFSNFYAPHYVSIQSALTNGFTYDLLYILLSIIATIAHVIYLYILLDILIFKHPIEKKIEIDKLCIPIFLFLAHLLDAFHAFCSVDVGCYKWFFFTKYLCPVFFLLTYITWLYRDLKNKSNKALWIVLDIVSIILIIVPFVCEIKIQWLLFFLSPTGSVIICIALYLLMNVLSYEVVSKEYREFYGNYLRQCYFVGTKIESTPSITINFENQDAINILDYGCGSGDRLEYKDLIKSTSHNIKINKIIGCDVMEDYRASFRTNAQKIFPSSTEICFETNVSDQDFIDSNLIVLSHVVYEFGVVKKIIRKLKKCNPGTIILVRVCSPNSIFTPVSISGSNNILSLKKNRGHLGCKWIDVIKEEAALSMINGSPYTIKQEIPIETEQQREAISKLLQHLYDGNLASYIQEYVKSLNNNGINSISNDDLIYLLKKD